MIDHLSSYALDFTQTRNFYSAVFGPLGVSLIHEFTVADDPDFPGRRVCSFGVDGASMFWIIESNIQATPRHVAFNALSRDAVDEFYRLALQQGAKSNGAPGLRPHYHANYYGAFVFDPDGNDIEAVCHN